MNNDIVTVVRQQLKELKDEKYRSFTAKLLPPATEVIGVRIPQLRLAARELAADSELAETYLTAAEQTTGLMLEEKLCWGFVIGYSDLPLIERLERIRRFVPAIDNWSVCDCVCNTFKFARKNQAEVWKFLQPYFKSEREYEIRFAIVMGMDFFIDSHYIEQLLAAIADSRRDAYYVQMGAAWAVSVCLVKFPDITFEYLRSDALDAVTHNKAIQKICESRRVSPLQKAAVKELRRR